MPGVFVPPPMHATNAVGMEDGPKATTIRDLRMGFLTRPAQTVEIKPLIRPDIMKLGKCLDQEKLEEVLVEESAKYRSSKHGLPAFAMLNKVAVKATKPKALAKPIKKDICLPLKPQRGIYVRLGTAFCSDSLEVKTPKPSRKK